MQVQRMMSQLQRLRGPRWSHNWSNRPVRQTAQQGKRQLRRCSQQAPRSLNRQSVRCCAMGTVCLQLCGQQAAHPASLALQQRRFWMLITEPMQLWHATYPGRGQVRQAVGERRCQTRRAATCLEHACMAQPPPPAVRQELRQIARRALQPCLSRRLVQSCRRSCRWSSTRQTARTMAAATQQSRLRKRTQRPAHQMRMQHTLPALPSLRCIRPQRQPQMATRRFLRGRLQQGPAAWVASWAGARPCLAQLSMAQLLHLHPSPAAAAWRRWCHVASSAALAGPQLSTAKDSRPERHPCSPWALRRMAPCQAPPSGCAAGLFR